MFITSFCNDNVFILYILTLELLKNNWRFLSLKCQGELHHLLYRRMYQSALNVIPGILLRRLRSWPEQTTNQIYSIWVIHISLVTASVSDNYSTHLSLVQRAARRLQRLNFSVFSSQVSEKPKTPHIKTKLWRKLLLLAANGRQQVNLFGATSQAECVSGSREGNSSGHCLRCASQNRRFRMWFE